MKKIFKVTGLNGFDLLRFSKDEFYLYLDQEYYKQFNQNIEILEANILLIRDGIKIEIITFNKLPLFLGKRLCFS